MEHWNIGFGGMVSVLYDGRFKKHMIRPSSANLQSSIFNFSSPGLQRYHNDRNGGRCDALDAGGLAE